MIEAENTLNSNTITQDKYRYLFEFATTGIQVQIEQDEQEEEYMRKKLEREKMLRNAVKIASTGQEAVFGIIKMKSESNECYPSDNDDWRNSGLYK